MKATGLVETITQFIKFNGYPADTLLSNRKFVTSFEHRLPDLLEKLLFFHHSLSSTLTFEQQKLLTTCNSFKRI